MPFYKVPLRPSDAGDVMFDFVIVEDETSHSAYETASALIPPVFGDAEEDERFDLFEIVEVKEPFKEPWPILTQAYFKRVEASLEDVQIDIAVRASIRAQIAAGKK